MTESAAGDRFAKAWQANYSYLVNLAFRMLGDVCHAEDIVQETFARLAETLGKPLHVKRRGFRKEMNSEGSWTFL